MKLLKTHVSPKQIIIQSERLIYWMNPKLSDTQENITNSTFWPAIQHPVQRHKDKTSHYHNQKTYHHGSIFQTLAGVNRNVNVIVLWQISVACRDHYYLKRTYTTSEQTTSVPLIFSLTFTVGVSYNPKGRNLILFA